MLIFLFILNRMCVCLWGNGRIREILCQTRQTDVIHMYIQFIHCFSNGIHRTKAFEFLARSLPGQTDKQTDTLKYL